MIENRLDKRIMLTNKILLGIAEIDELKGKWSGSLSLNPRILGQLRRSVIITSTGSSTRIEGSKMTDNEIDRFLRGLNQKTPKGRDEEEVAGYADILGRIFDHYNTLKITEGGIFHLHDLMLKFSKKDELHRGKYKTKDNTVAIVENGKVKEILFSPTSPWLVKKEMDDVLFFLDCVLEQTKQALKLVDGNDPSKLLSEIQKQIFNQFIFDNELSVSEVQNKTGIALSTVKQALSRLVKNKLIERLGQGRSTRYKKLHKNNI